MSDDLQPGEATDPDRPSDVRSGDTAYTPTSTTTIERGGARGAWLLTMVAFLAFVGLVAGVALVMGDDEGDQLRPLGLTRQEARDESAGAPTAGGDAMYPYQDLHFRLSGDLPDLGDEAPVYRLAAPSMDQSRVTALAQALGIGGAPSAVDGSWCVAGDGRQLMVIPGTGAWYVSYFASEGAGELSCDTGRGSSGGSGGSDDVGKCSIDGDVQVCETDAGVPTTFVGVGEEIPANPPDVDDPGLAPEPLPSEPTAPTGPEDLPSADEAERIARSLLTEMGALGGDWSVEVTDGMMMGWAQACSSDGVCTEETGGEIVMSRAVTFTRVVEGTKVLGLQWYVDIADHGMVTSVNGALTELVEVGAYPLRPTADVYADLESGKSYFGVPMPLGEIRDGGVVALDTGVAVAEKPMAGSDRDAVAGDEPGFAPGPCPEGAACMIAGGSTSGTAVATAVEECPANADCVPPSPPEACKVQPDGREICEAPEPMPTPDCKPQPDGTEYCVDPMPMPEPVPCDVQMDPDVAEDLKAREEAAAEEAGDDPVTSGDLAPDVDCVPPPVCVPGEPPVETTPPLPGEPSVGTGETVSVDDTVKDDDAGGDGVIGAPGSAGSTDPGMPDDCIVPEPGPIPEPMPEPVSITITIDGPATTLGAQLFEGLDGATPTAYVVPTYVFVGEWPDGGGEYRADLPAIEEQYLGGGEPPTTAPPTTEPPTTEPPTTGGTEPPVTEPPVTIEPPTTVVPPTIVDGESPVTVYVSNQSFELPDVHITVAIDGETLADDTFAVEGQHNFVPFTTTLAPGEHTLTSVSDDGEAKASVTFAADGERWLTVFYWGTPGGTGDAAPKLDISVSETPIGFQ